MRTVLLGDSHLARVRRDLPLIGADVVNAAVGGAVAADVLGQAERAGVGGSDVVVLSVGANDSFEHRSVSTSAFARQVEALLDQVRPSRWVYVAPPLAMSAPWREEAARRFVAAGGTVVDTPRLLAPLGDLAYADDGMHLTGAAYRVLLPAVRRAVTREPRRFVVQRHRARTLHFDLRLEVDGVLVSWAVPKGPSLDPADKRLAVKVGDHDVAHAGFEGPAGTGSVVVWDTGTYDNLTVERGEAVEMAAAVAGGHLKVALHGLKLAGAFSLRRTSMGGDDSNWLLVKVLDEDADRERRPTETENESVLSGRTNEDFERP